MPKVEIGRDKNHKPIYIEPDEEFSWKDYTGRPCREIPNNTTVYATCFSQEIPDSEVFPESMTGVTFYNCNLDNCVLPAGNTVIGGSQKRYIVQNDNNDWLIDNNGNPVEPINKKHLEQQGLSTNPKDIPVAYIEEQTMTLAEYEAQYGKV